MENDYVEIKRSKGLTFAVERVKTNANVVNQRKVEKAKEENLLSEVSSEANEFINIEEG